MSSASEQDAVNRRLRSVQSHLKPNLTAGTSTKEQYIPRTLFHPAKAPCKAEYDYIVVGAGSAGAALAARLAQKLPNKTILIVDAGGDPRQLRVTQPFITCAGLQNSDLDFAYRTTPQPLQQNRRSHWPRGKVLGGCSTINYMVAVRGDSRGYDKWESEMGCSGWSFANLEKYFNRLEDYRGSYDLPRRGRQGPITITDNRDINYLTKPTVEAFVKACSECGIPEVADYNAPYVKQSAGATQTTIRNSKRCDTATAYLFGEFGAFALCPNLSCLEKEHVARVLFDKSNATPRANGVELVSGPVIRAREEVILCAGAVGSAHILLLSGIGPRVHLEAKKVQVVADLPGVGRNMKDHLMVAHVFEVRPDFLGAFHVDNPLNIVSQIARYFVFGDGVFSTSWIQAVAFKDSSIQKQTDANDIQIHFVPMLGNGDEEQGKRNFGFDRSIHEMASKKDRVPPGITFLPSLLQPRSMGYIELATNDPKDHPIIEPCYLSHPDDIKVFLEAWKFCDEIAASKAMKPVVKGPWLDDSVKFPYGSDEYALYKIKRDAITIYHPTSTCKMGPDSDPLSVLDPATLAVRKVTNLRVADCASFPDIPAANTNLAAIMIGERAADLIAFGPIPKQ